MYNFWASPTQFRQLVFRPPPPLPRRILKEVSVLLDALEKRQLALENENKQLREDLAGAANMIEEADAARLMLEQRLLERDAELAEKRDGVFDNSE